MKKNISPIPIQPQLPIVSLPLCGNLPPDKQLELVQTLTELLLRQIQELHLKLTQPTQGV